MTAACAVHSVHMLDAPPSAIKEHPTTVLDKYQLEGLTVREGDLKNPVMVGYRGLA